MMVNLGSRLIVVPSSPSSFELIVAAKSHHVYLTMPSLEGKEQ